MAIRSQGVSYDMDKLDDVFDLLRLEQRRYVLYYLEQQDRPVPISEVAMKVQEWENEAVSPQDFDNIVEELTIQLQHRDIPKLRKAEYIEYDPASNEIELSGIPAEVSVLLSVTEAIEQPAEDDIAHL